MQKDSFITMTSNVDIEQILTTLSKKNILFNHLPNNNPKEQQIITGCCENKSSDVVFADGSMAVFTLGLIAEV